MRGDEAYGTVAGMSTKRAHLADLTRQFRRYLKWQRAQGVEAYVPAGEEARAVLEAQKKARQEAQLARLRGDDEGEVEETASATAKVHEKGQETPDQGDDAKSSPARPSFEGVGKKKAAEKTKRPSAGASTAMPWKNHRAMYEIDAEKKKKASQVQKKKAESKKSGPPVEEAPPWQGDPEGPGPSGPPPGPPLGERRGAKQESTTQASTKKPETPAEKMDFLERYLGDCQRCPLSQSRTQIVFGNGDPTSDLMFIGEGPGGEEDRQGLPFVGRSGKLLDKMIEAMGLSRDKVYVTNVVKCRPPDNRNPAPLEVKECSPFLKKQIEVVEPKVIVTVGKFATNAVLGRDDEPLGRLRGRWHEHEGIAVMPTYHPAYLLRQEPDKGPKRKTWGDLQKVMGRLGLS